MKHSKNNNPTRIKGDIFTPKPKIKPAPQRFSEYDDLLHLKEIIGLDNPWPLKDVLNMLIKASEILLHDKNYDGPNYEEMEVCVRRGKEIMKLLTHEK